MSMNILLVCTVGGSPEPLVAALKHWKPERVIFIASKETTPAISGKILPLASQEGFPLAPGCYDIHPLPGAADFSGCVQAIGRLNDQVRSWVGRGEEFRVVVDFTGGTKCMTAALALQSQQWPCVFSYVGGSERTKDGVGIVVSGKEQVLNFQNPWNSLGYQAVEAATILFDRGAYAMAANHLADAIRRISDPTVKRELAALTNLAEAYYAWDCFKHSDAHRMLSDVQKSANDILKVFGPKVHDSLFEQIRDHLRLLGKLKDAVGPTLDLVHDLLANAQRRAHERRFDDAVARIYRATEALAQSRLASDHKISDTSDISISLLPPNLQKGWSYRARNGSLKLGLQEDYALLKDLNDPLGHKFSALQWDDDKKSPLTSRNQSILAHGFAPVGEKVYQALWKGVLQLTDLQVQNLPKFPTLAKPV